jgi:hypothetical protein
MSSFPEENPAYQQVSSQASGEDNGQSQSSNGGDVRQPDSANVDKIREILFGGQMRDYERRFTRVEDRLIKESADLREDTRKRFDALEMFVKKEFAELAHRLQAEHRTRDEAMHGLWCGLHDTGQALEAKLTELQEHSAGAQSDLRQQILEQSKNLSDEIRHRQDELTAMLQREVAQLNHEKTDRSSLATLFTEMALRLENDLKIPVAN